MISFHSAKIFGKKKFPKKKKKSSGKVSLNTERSVTNRLTRFYSFISSKGADAVKHNLSFFEQQGEGMG